MSPETCPGCGRPVDGEPVSCPGCGRSLARGTEVPPGWGVAKNANATAPRVPAWRLAGLETARPADGPESTLPRTPAEIFLPPPRAAEEQDDETLEGGPGWRLRPRRPRPLTWTPAAAAVAVGPALPPRALTRLFYWALVGGILATSSAAVLLLTVHMVRSR